MRKVPVAVRESPGFSAWADAHWSRDEYDAFIDYIARNPEAGEIIPGGGGIRKVRWSASGRGKRGGARVIYYFRDELMPLILMIAYAKNQQLDLNKKDLAKLRLWAKDLKETR